jgi:hypothetical protein
MKILTVFGTRPEAIVLTFQRLKATDYGVGLLLNFGMPYLHHKRRVV